MNTALLINKLARELSLERDEFNALLYCKDDALYKRACEARASIFGNKIYTRGLIEFTNYCRNNCYYCGLRRNNTKLERYRLDKEQILECCAEGYDAGFRTFVLQGGEDAEYTDEVMTDIIRAVKSAYPDCAVTLSLGERSYASLKALREAGADRYLLRQETSDAGHFGVLHPPELTLVERQSCLLNLKELGYQTGCGFMVGSPGQTSDNIIRDLLFIQEFDPEMAGVGPFIPHTDTPMNDEEPGDLRLTLNVIAILRLMKPNLLLPATTALGTLADDGREQGIRAGANVLMFNISPPHARDKYILYDNKVCTAESAKARLEEMKRRLPEYEFAVTRGDYA